MFVIQCVNLFSSIVVSFVLFVIMSDTEKGNVRKKVKKEDDLQQLTCMVSSPETVPSTSQSVKWTKSDSDGNIVYGRPRSSHTQTPGHSQHQSKGTRGTHVRDIETTCADADRFATDTTGTVCSLLCLHYDYEYNVNNTAISVFKDRL